MPGRGVATVAWRCPLGARRLSASTREPPPDTGGAVGRDRRRAKGKMSGFALRDRAPARDLCRCSAQPTASARLTLQRCWIGGEGGIRTHVGRLCPQPISSRCRCDRFGTSPGGTVTGRTTAQPHDHHGGRRLAVRSGATGGCGQSPLTVPGAWRLRVAKQRHFTPARGERQGLPHNSRDSDCNSPHGEGENEGNHWA